MRSLWMLGTIGVLLSGCVSEKGGRTAETKTVEAAASNKTSSLPPGPQHPHDHSDSIPAAFHGVYDGSLEGCARPSIERLTVSARELRFHESSGAVRSVAYGGSDAIAVEADYEGEGERWRSLRILALAENGTRLTVKGEGTRLERVRCPNGARQR